MSFSDAIGQVDQILQWQQQLVNPASAATAASVPTGTSTAGAATGSSSGSGSEFAQALVQAQSSSEAGDLTSELGSSTDSDTATGSDLLGGNDGALIQALTQAGASASSVQAAVGAASGGTAESQVQAMVGQANSLVGKPYIWGGGHDGWGQQRGYDCSGFVSAVLHAGGYLQTPQDTQTLPGAAGIESGPGQYVTIYDRTDAGSSDDHVIIDIGGQFYESGGERGAWGGGGGVQKIETPPAAYLATFNRVLHPSGL